MIYLEERQPTSRLKIGPNGRIKPIQDYSSLSPNLTLTVQILKGLSAIIIPKLLSPRGRHRGSGRGPIGSSFPRHGARIRTKTQSKRTKKTQKTKLRENCKLAQKNIKQKLYDA